MVVASNQAQLPATDRTRGWSNNRSSWSMWMTMRQRWPGSWRVSSVSWASRVSSTCRRALLCGVQAVPIVLIACGPRVEVGPYCANRAPQQSSDVVLRERREGTDRWIATRRSDGVVYETGINYAGDVVAEGPLTADLRYRNGQWCLWGSKGSLQELRTYLHGVRVGRQRTWHSNGNISAVEMFVDDRREGLCCYWASNGKLEFGLSGYYDNGARIRPCDARECAKPRRAE